MKRYTVTAGDVGKTAYHPVKERCSHGYFHNEFPNEFPFEPLGRVLPGDVGKLCKKINGLWYVENDEQFNKRTKGRKHIEENEGF
jgi:hypothetical protein